jgi:pimeloyl-ACP methyl ester carboxylesterase
MSAIILEGDIVHYEVLGRGRPVIFLHGWVGSWRYWIPSMQATSTAYRAYALDLWGFGDTAKSPERYSLEAQTNLLDSFLTEMGIGKVALVGHGLGGVVALLYAKKLSFVVDRVMVVGLPVKKEDLNERLQTESPAELATWLLAQDPAMEAARAEAPKADVQAIKTSLENLQTLDLTGLTQAETTATLLVHGQNDPAVRPSLEEVHGSLPGNAHHIVFEESAHFPMLDQPSKFNRLLADFLALESGESPRQLQLKEEWKRRVR